MLVNAFKLALREIRRNLLRSFLTMLGIIIGVAAVITMVALGQGATRQVTEQVSRLGTNLMMVRQGQGFGRGRGRVDSPPFEMHTVDAIRAEIAGLNAVAPVSDSRATLVYGNNNWLSVIRGTTNDYLRAANWTLASGRAFSPIEERGGATVCIIGSTVRSQLFRDTDPLGARVRVSGFSCTVVGTLESKGQTTFGSDQDDVVLMPLRAYQRRLSGERTAESIYLSLRDGVSSERVEARLETLLRELRDIGANQEDDFHVRDTKELADTLTVTTRTMTGLLGAVAGVSLLVGGIGIMNIMLVSVTERTREIGIRLAIGALEHEVLWQFLVEAVVLSSIGGVLGVLLAAGLSAVMSVAMQVPYVFDAPIAAGAFLFSAAIGIAFGYFPARRAARLNPIEALRYE